MDERTRTLIDTLEREHALSLSDYAYMIEHRSARSAQLLAEKAVAARRTNYGNAFYVRGLIEITNI